MVAEMSKKLQQVLFDYDKINAKNFMEALDNLHHLDRDKTFEFVVGLRDLYLVFELMHSSDLFPVQYGYEIEDMITTGKTFSQSSPVLKDGRVAKVEVRLIGDIVYTTTTNMFGRRGSTFIWLKEILERARIAELNMNFDFASINDGGQTEQS
jgi:hypothetical protein